MQTAQRERRPRSFLLSSIGENARKCKILFIFKRLRRDPAAGQEQTLQKKNFLSAILAKAHRFQDNPSLFMRLAQRNRHVFDKVSIEILCLFIYAKGRKIGGFYAFCTKNGAFPREGWEFEMQVVVLIGGFGSGKTEIALNMAIHHAREGAHTALVDMDVLNPMFKSTFQEKRLLEAGVTLISPEDSRGNTDNPSVSPDARAAFQGKYEWSIVDVAGDSNGAIVLGQFHTELSAPESGLQVLLVVNAMRPASDSVERIIALIRRIEAASRLRITGIINNTNLSVETTPELLLEGDRLLRQITEQTGIPVRYCVSTPEVLAALAEQYPNTVRGEPYPIRLYTKPDWLTFYCAKENRKRTEGGKNV
jgi:hypothetical protein